MAPHHPQVPLQLTPHLGSARTPPHHWGPPQEAHATLGGQHSRSHRPVTPAMREAGR